ncbi:MAG: methionyl-tRNA formyltransferase [Candidatus Yanofskybacteria bacterium RIFCSPLOWO2_12_FULL_43_11b]|uniref:Methionyl-tRNA formyltransferase n=1 Tax=Candidatus Yanofskybacteria bacterium RIFCSPLOWO2_12_FULL_43_11b TaxID=1802710 RepID=A0A1F8H6N3_9BACT|nr:MAG: methionyl-tRNA formyltransferase [Candidatus Yanofskybacteria bacterium RIFCSPHIGHO2_01_FULL_43_32]OGN11981.1 MAG: methionyl-tRNA formyltransferase [Candidatus Yanofskybacteria bacterium RIFCSPHIGHO2_02_FULL_43_12]OGN24766.1 MAG: methionyl-tRNA formyltransferase [Candidatus Yanofskybacteria bacterium RIFCSPLOWO2_01_FULL_43_46]OGN33235.1 MAG: methionyl-tRNA formyltransferase [Candidatus Yanofskybacteria bacterium RIFCSPLOWO2_12_FULL_43_11b]
MGERRLKTVFFGTPGFTAPVLKALLNNGGYDIVAVFTGRGPLAKLAEEHGIKVYQPVSLKKDDLVFEEFKNLKPDICVVAAYGKIFSKRFLDIPRYGFVNVHPSLLPEYRGPSPIQTALLNGDKETGAAIMLIDEKIDHGPLLAEEKYDIGVGKDLVEISEELFGLGAKLLIKTLPGYIGGDIKPREQDHSKATFTKIFTRGDGRINWNDPAQEIYNRIRALNPEPGTWTLLRSSGASEEQTKIINIKSAEIVNGKLQIKTIQMEGKKEMPFEEFLRGHPDFDISQLK